MAYEYDATLVRVLDGDTVVFRLERTYTTEVDFGFWLKDRLVARRETQMTFRLLGVTAPEVRSDEGNAAATELARLLALGPMRLTSYKPDKYGRWRCRVQVMLSDGTSFIVNEEMVKRGFAVPSTIDES